jgi:hypothetical protein
MTQSLSCLLLLAGVCFLPEVHWQAPGKAREVPENFRTAGPQVTKLLSSSCQLPFWLCSEATTEQALVVTPNIVKTNAKKWNKEELIQCLQFTTLNFYFWGFLSL